MNYLKISLTALLSIIELFILTKIMGRRQISQLSFFDYINGITIGSIAAEMSLSSFDEIYKPAIAMLIYSVVAIVFSYSSNKSIVLRRFLVGKSLILMDNGKIYKNNLSKSGLDINELLTQCRANGYFDINDLQTVIIEANGQLSFLEKSSSAPLKVKDMNIINEEAKINIVLISDGKILKKNLISAKRSKQWLYNELKRQNINDINEVLLGTYDGTFLSIYMKEYDNNPTDYFC